MKRAFVSLFVLAVACFAGCSIEGRIGREREVEPRYSEEEARQIQNQVVEPVEKDN